MTSGQKYHCLECEIDDVIGDTNVTSQGVLVIGLTVVFTVLYRTNFSFLLAFSLNLPHFSCQPLLTKGYIIIVQQCMGILFEYLRV